MNILVTGGSSGLGKAIVERLVNQNDDKILFTFNRHEEEAVSLVSINADRIQSFKCDFRHTLEVERLVGHIEQFDPDVLINNAYVGLPQGKHFHKIGITEFAESFQDNLLPTIRITQACIDVFRKKKFGKIVNILTTYLLNLPPAGLSVYTANKAYLQQLSKTWNTEYGKYNITSNCVSPAFMQTNLSEGVDERVVEELENNHPLHRLLTPEEVADTVAYLVYASQQVNGVNIAINSAQDIMK